MQARRGSCARSSDNSAVPTRRGGPRLAVLLVAAVSTLVALVGQAAAEQRPDDGPPGPDKVTLQPSSGTNSRVTLSGRILDYTGTSLTIELMSAGAVRVFPASQVVDVQTPQTEFHVAGLLKFSQSEFDAAQAAFRKALDVETRSWVRREILAMLVRSSLKQGHYESAGSQFDLLVKSDPSTRHFKLIPLLWAADNPDAGLKNAARLWLSDALESTRLLGASVLLHDERFVTEAKRELNTLTASTDQRVRVLARAQLWRARLGAGNLSSGEIDQWEADIEAMPGDLRGGPYYVLGTAHFGRSEHDRAAMAMLWLPLVYHDDHFLAARACLHAAEALARLGQKDDAVTLYREVAQRFRTTPFADEARRALELIPD